MKIILDTKKNINNYKLPIISYGIIVYTKKENTIKYLMIRRKDSVGYIDILRGKYILYFKKYLQNIINVMTNEEKENLLKKNFKELWDNMWGKNSSIQYRNEEKNAEKKLEFLKLGINTNNSNYTLESLIEESNTSWEENEWGFPKGRKNYQEKDLYCALREFEEETGISKSKIDIISNLFPLEEIFIGSNFKCYKHKYYLAYLKDSNIDLNNFQKSEVSKLEWKTKDECLESIRDYQHEKKELIHKIDTILKDTFIIS